MNKLTGDDFEQEKIGLTPDSGFNRVGIDDFAGAGGQLHAVGRFGMCQDALHAKKQEKSRLVFRTRVQEVNFYTDKSVR